MKTRAVKSGFLVMVHFIVMIIVAGQPYRLDAQVNTGSALGPAGDKSDALIPRAKVTLCGHNLRPAVHAIDQFKTQTTTFNADYGRSARSVLNATINSGTNKFHSDFWEFIRNDKLDAADFFRNAGNLSKGEFRRNPFGFAEGGAVRIPNVHDGRNRNFFFGNNGDIRIRQAGSSITTGSKAVERASNYTDFGEMVTGQQSVGPITDLLGRTFPAGTVFNPATTRAVTIGRLDAVTGLLGQQNGFVSDPLN